MCTSPHFWSSRQFNLHTLSQHSHIFSRARGDEAYKQKSQKVQPVDLSLSNGSKPDGSDAWKIDAIQKEIPILDPADKYTNWLISKFTSIAKGARLTLERLGKMIIGDGMMYQEKKVLIERLYTREAVLVCDFTKMGKVKREVAPSQKIRTIEHKT